MEGMGVLSAVADEATQKIPSGQVVRWLSDRRCV